MTWSPSLDRHLHADHDRLLADVEVAEAADQAHAVELAGLLLEAADQQHLAVGGELLLAAEGAGPSAGRWDGTCRARLDLPGDVGNLRVDYRAANVPIKASIAAPPRWHSQLSCQSMVSIEPKRSDGRASIDGSRGHLRAARRRRIARPQPRPAAAIHAIVGSARPAPAAPRRAPGGRARPRGARSRDSSMLERSINSARASKAAATVECVIGEVARD